MRRTGRLIRMRKVVRAADETGTRRTRELGVELVANEACMIARKYVINIGDLKMGLYIHSLVPSVALMYTKEAPLALTVFILTLVWKSETSMPVGSARFSRIGADATRAAQDRRESRTDDIITTKESRGERRRRSHGSQPALLLRKHSLYVDVTPRMRRDPRRRHVQAPASLAAKTMEAPA